MTENIKQLIEAAEKNYNENVKIEGLKRGNTYDIHMKRQLNPVTIKITSIRKSNNELQGRKIKYECILPITGTLATVRTTESELKDSIETAKIYFTK